MDITYHNVQIRCISQRISSYICEKRALFPDYNVARITGGATCDESSYSDPDHTCVNALLEDERHWETNGEGPGAWIKVSFPRTNTQLLGLKSVCDESVMVKTLTVDIDSTGSDLFDVSPYRHW